MNLVNDIVKRLIVNGMTGSSWRFERFDRIWIIVNTDQESQIGKEFI